jgi:hypothetical protein
LEQGWGLLISLPSVRSRPGGGAAVDGACRAMGGDGGAVSWSSFAPAISLFDLQPDLDKPPDGFAFANFRPTRTLAPSGPTDSSCNSPSATAKICPGP